MLSILVIFPVVSFQVSLALMILFWGSPLGEPLLPHELSRIILWSLIALMTPWLFRSEIRPLLIPLIIAFVVISRVPVYSVHHAFLAVVRALQEPNLAPVALGAIGFGGLNGLLLVRGILLRTATQLSFAKGSTQWGSASAMKKPTDGLLLGKIGKEYLRYDGDGHLITVAATRSGKGVGTVIPNLLNYRGSMLVTDPKGENYTVTAAWRREVLGQEVIALDPFRLMEAQSPGLASLNPMEFIDLDGEDYVETAMMLADMIVGRGHQVEESHWNLEAKGVLFSFILYVMASDKFQGSRNLITVRSLLTQDEEGLAQILEAMKLSELDSVREGACRIEQKADRERSGVLSTVQSKTHFLSSPRMRYVLTETSFDMEELRRGDMTIYIILPREYLSTFAPWLRLMITSSYYACTHGAAYKPRPSKRIVFLLDEFANLGYMQNIKEAVSLGGGYGMTMWLILQDLAQLKREYRSEWESFLANCEVMQAFAIQDPFTSQKITQILGEMSIWQRRLNQGQGQLFDRMRAGYEESNRPLLKPDELRRLHPDRQLIFMRPYQPVVADKLVYYRDPLTASRAQPNVFAG